MPDKSKSELIKKAKIHNQLFHNKNLTNHENINKYDYKSNFQNLKILYGREKEIKTINTIFNQVKKGNREIILISGYSGIGKSSLIDKLYYDSFKDSSFFIHGKFDQFDKNIPYKAIIQAFQDITKKLLKNNTDNLQRWKKEILQALGPNGQLLINFIPSLEQIIGKQPKLPKLGPMENQNRFNLFFQEFLKVFTKREKPLVLFLDDLQWADIASLNIMKIIISNLEIKNFLFIGTYRNNEIDKDHPLRLILNELKENKIHIHKITLKPVNLSDACCIITTNLNCNYNEIFDLGNIVYKKTGGNPFFINEFLKSLYQDKILKYIPENNKTNKDKKNGNWNWDIKKVTNKKITDNVVDLFIGRINNFLINTLKLLKLAACIGSRFDLHTLSKIYNKSENETFSDFASIVKEGLLFYVGGYYTFVHDKIQEAVYSLIDNEEKKKIHYKIGKKLLKIFSKKDLNKNIFYIADQLNNGRQIITNKNEILQLIKLNLSAGKKAMESAAYDSAQKYFETGINLFNENSWNEQYDITLSLYTHATECAYLCTNYNLMNKYIEIVLCNGKNLIDKIKIYEINIQAYFVQNKFIEAIDLSKNILKKLDVPLPKKPNKFHIIVELLKNKIAIRGKDIDDLKKLPKMTDINKVAAIRIMITTCTVAYYTNPDLLPLMICKIINIVLKYGNSPESPYYYISYGLLTSELGNIQKGYKFCEFAINLVNHSNNRKLYVKVHFFFNLFIFYLKNHLKKTLEPLQKLCQIGLEVGDQEYAAIGAMTYCENLFFTGKKLSFVISEINKYYNFLKKIKQDIVCNSLQVTGLLILNLMSNGKKKIDFINKKLNESQMIIQLIKANDRASIANFYNYKVISSYLCNNFKNLFENIKKCNMYADALMGLFNLQIFYFYSSLSLVALYPSVNLGKKIKYLFIIKNNQRKMKKWAKHAPMNFLHKYYLVEAEYSRVLGKKSKAMKLYDKAIALTSKNEYLNEEALSNELAAKFYLSINNKHESKKYMYSAYNCYLEWEAYAKVKHIEENYSDLINCNHK